MTNEKDVFLESACEQVHYKPIRDSLRKELSDHIEDRAQEYEQDGMSKEEAQKRAVSHMGDPAEIGVEFQKLHHKRTCWCIIAMVLIMNLISFIMEPWNLAGDMVSTQEKFDNIFSSANFLFRFDIWLTLAVFLFTAFLGYFLLGRYRRMSALIILALLPFLAYITKLRISSIARIVLIYPIASIPFLCMLLYRYRANLKLALSLYLLGIAGVIVIFHSVWPYEYTLLLIHLLTCFIVLIVTCLKGWYQVNKKRMVGVDTKERTQDQSPYDGIVIRDLLSKSGFTKGVTMSKQDMIEYRSARYWRFDTKEMQERKEQENYAGMSIDYEDCCKCLYELEPRTLDNISMEDLLPFDDLFYPLAKVIIHHGWLAFLLSFSSCIFLSIQAFFAILREFGFSFSTPIEFPFSYRLMLIDICDAFLLGLIFSAYRYDHVCEND